MTLDFIAVKNGHGANTWTGTHKYTHAHNQRGSWASSCLYGFYQWLFGWDVQKAIDRYCKGRRSSCWLLTCHETCTVLEPSWDSPKINFGPKIPFRTHEYLTHRTWREAWLVFDLPPSRQTLRTVLSSHDPTNLPVIVRHRPFWSALTFYLFVLFQPDFLKCSHVFLDFFRFYQLCKTFNCVWMF